jgi:uncharacterized protein YigA (DUF484 family)
MYRAQVINAAPRPQETDADSVAAYLRAHPSFLVERQELYRSLEPPARVHGDVLADHMAAMLRAERAHARDMQGQASSVLQAGRAAAGIAERIQAAVLALLQANDVSECVTDVLPGVLGVDAAALCCEGFAQRWRILPPGAVRVLMRGRPVVFRDHPADAALLHAEAALLAERDVLIRLDCRRPSLLALVSRDPCTLPMAQGTQSFAFLGGVLSALLRG